MPNHPIVFLPGYYGTKFHLKSTKEVVWIDLENIFTPKRVMDLLRLDQPNDPVFAYKILDSIDLRPFFCLHIYRKLKRFLTKTLGYNSQQVFGHPIDWRQSLDLLADDVEKTLSLPRFKNTKVDLLCHSHGGLVARAYLTKYGTGRVARCITLGTPHHGMLKVLEAIYSGIDLYTFNKDLTKDAARTMPSAFELLPRSATEGMFEWNAQASDPLRNTDWLDVFNGEPNLKKAMVEKLADALKTTQNLLLPRIDVPAYFLYGTRLTTMVCAKGSPQVPLQFEKAEEGDNTVAMVSARGDGIAGSVTRCPAPFANHTTIFNEPYVRKLLKSILLQNQLPQNQVQVVAAWENKFYFPNTQHKISVEVRDHLGKPLQNAQVQLLVYVSGQFHHPIINQNLPQTPHGDFLGTFPLPFSLKPLKYRVRVTHPNISSELRDQKGLLRMR